MFELERIQGLARREGDNMKYIIITEQNPTLLENVVNEHLDLGLKLQGGICLSFSEDDGDLYCQAMIDEEE